jgi:hypothetical protein
VDNKRNFSGLSHHGIQSAAACVANVDPEICRKVAQLWDGSGNIPSFFNKIWIFLKIAAVPAGETPGRPASGLDRVE